MIEEIELYLVPMPMKAPWKTAFGVIDTIDVVFVRLRMDGVDGWSEVAPYQFPQYSSEWAEGAFYLIRNVLAPRLLGEQIHSGTELQRMLSLFKGNYFAKAGLDNAWWDAFSKIQQKPLWQAIGGVSKQITVGADIPVLNSFDDLSAAIKNALSMGFTRIKLKFCDGWGLNMVAYVRESFPDTVFHVDCNSGYTLADLNMFKELDQYGLAMIEQPLAHDDLVDHARLQAHLKTPICLDESVTSLHKAKKAIEIGACGWINIKAGRVGGITHAMEIHDLCKAKSMPCWVGSMLESATGQGASLALATLSNMQYPADIFPSDRLYQKDFSRPEIALTAPSTIFATEAVGCGFEPDVGRLQAAKTHHAIVRAT